LGGEPTDLTDLSCLAGERGESSFASRNNIRPEYVLPMVIWGRILGKPDEERRVEKWETNYKI